MNDEKYYTKELIKQAIEENRIRIYNVDGYSKGFDVCAIFRKRGTEVNEQIECNWISQGTKVDHYEHFVCYVHPFPRMIGFSNKNIRNDILDQLYKHVSTY